MRDSLASSGECEVVSATIALGVRRILGRKETHDEQSRVGSRPAPDRQCPPGGGVRLPGQHARVLRLLHLRIRGSLVFGHIFFPRWWRDRDPAVDQHPRVAYVARPLGAVLWGTLGRPVRPAQRAAGVPAHDGHLTFVIGCLPTYDQIGMAAPVILVLLRLLQGLSAGGESPGVVVAHPRTCPPTGVARSSPRSR